MNPIEEPVLVLRTATQLTEAYEKERAARLKIGRWGAWYLCGQGKWLGFKGLYPNKNVAYEFELAAKSPLQWFCHMREKIYPNRGDLEDLLAAFDDIFGPGWFRKEVYRRR